MPETEKKTEEKPKDKPKEKAEEKLPREHWLSMEGQSMSEEELCEWMARQVTKHPVVKNQHGKWMELIEWELGNQFTMWDEGKRQVLPVDLNVRKKRVVINLMKPLIETIEGKLNFHHSIIGVPNSSEDVDIFGSYAATKLLNFNDHVNSIDDLMEETKDDLLRPGISCAKWIWDIDASGWVAPKKAAEKGKNGGRMTPDLSQKTEADGEVMGEVLPIFNIRPDPTAKTPKKMRWCMEIKEVRRQEMLDRFSEHGLTERKLDELKEDDSAKEEGRYVISEDVDQEAETYVIREFWEKPNRWYKEGRYLVTCAKMLLYAGKSPSPHGKLPYFFFFFHKSKYSFWARGPLHFVQDIQREFNRMISLISEHIEAWRPKMAVGPGALKRAEAFTTGPFEILEVDFSRGEPKPIQMPELSAQVTAYRDFLISSVDRVSNVHEVSYSRLPQYASRAPASLYSMMLEQESLKLSPMIRRVNKTLVEMARFRLELMDQHYDLPRMTQVIGKQRAATIEYFDRTDINKNFDVRLENGVSINQSNTIQTRLLIEMWEKGILTEQDRLKILEFLPLGTAEYEIRPDIADKRGRSARTRPSLMAAMRSYRSIRCSWMAPGSRIRRREKTSSPMSTSTITMRCISISTRPWSRPRSSKSSHQRLRWRSTSISRSIFYGLTTRCRAR